jgi:hypothetical protein
MENNNNNKFILKDDKKICTATNNAQEIYTEIRITRPEQKKEFIVVFDNKKVFVNITCVAKREGK